MEGLKYSEIVVHKGWAIAVFLIVIILIVGSVYVLSGRYAEVQRQGQMECYNKFYYNNTEMAKLWNLNNSRLDCNKWNGMCFCKFYLGKGFVMYNGNLSEVDFDKTE
jgi:type II secretory pathway pseudopilin PulG